LQQCEVTDDFIASEASYIGSIGNVQKVQTVTKQNLIYGQNLHFPVIYLIFTKYITTCVVVLCCKTSISRDIPIGNNYQLQYATVHVTHCNSVA